MDAVSTLAVDSGEHCPLRTLDNCVRAFAVVVVVDGGLCVYLALRFAFLASRTFSQRAMRRTGRQTIPARAMLEPDIRNG